MKIFMAYCSLDDTVFVTAEVTLPASIDISVESRWSIFTLTLTQILTLKSYVHIVVVVVVFIAVVRQTDRHPHTLIKNKGKPRA